MGAGCTNRRLELGPTVREVRRQPFPPSAVACFVPPTQSPCLNTYRDMSKNVDAEDKSPKRVVAHSWLRIKNEHKVLVSNHANGLYTASCESLPALQGSAKSMYQLQLVLEDSLAAIKKTSKVKPDEQPSMLSSPNKPDGVRDAWPEDEPGLDELDGNNPLSDR